MDDLRQQQTPGWRLLTDIILVITVPIVFVFAFIVELIVWIKEKVYENQV